MVAVLTVLCGAQLSPAPAPTILLPTALCIQVCKINGVELLEVFITGWRKTVAGRRPRQHQSKSPLTMLSFRTLGIIRVLCHSVSSAASCFASPHCPAATCLLLLSLYFHWAAILQLQNLHFIEASVSQRLSIAVASVVCRKDRPHILLG